MKETLKNEQIVLQEVRLIGPNSEQLGLVSSEKANEIASSYNLDLVLIAPEAKPPVCKIMDYGKFKFDELKKLKDQKKNQKVAKLKEMPLSMTIDNHDLEIKAKQVCKFLADGSKVKVNIRMKGRITASGKNAMRRTYQNATITTTARSAIIFRLMPRMEKNNAFFKSLIMLRSKVIIIR